ncbi:GNAT family N-acetyltransferase [Erythrobacter sp. YT30]|uniref:GNAT family N-acetyltransferase n=1 Tax=Erythrobacter sp. YT30 TaxID=1735012 RepID=UPI00076CDC3F|nr:GNAT family N-acetyltransferase [Erythrobacter sp. YT30]KWV93083.1 hypothetical protein AUC45_02865 [Erythrobacter sp. YT30]
MIKASYHDSVKDVQAKFDALGSLESVASAPFDRVQWYELLEQTGLQPLYACAEGGDAFAMLALTQKSGRIASLRNWYNFTWRPIATSEEATGALIGQIATELKTRAHRITLEPVPQEDGTAEMLALAFAGAGWRVEVSQCDVNHVINLHSKTFSEYWAERPGPLRTTLKRKGRQVTTRIIKSFDAELWDQYEQIYASSWKPEEDHPDMLRAFAQAEAREGRLRLGLAFHEGQPIAAQFWTVDNGCAYIHKLAHLEEHQNLSAGTVLSAALFEHVIDNDGVSTIDFGTGHQSYKADWMGETRPRYRIDCLNRKRPAAWIDLAILAFGRLRDADVPKLAPRPTAG